MTITSSNRIDSTVDNEPGYGQILAILLRRWVWLAGGIVGALLIAAVLGMRQKPVYESSLQLLVEPNYQTPKTDSQPGQGSQFSQFVDATLQVDSSTQISLMQSSELVQRAMKLLQKDYPGLDPTDQNSVAAFKKAITVAPYGGDSIGGVKLKTKIIKVTYAGSNPTMTRDVAKALQKVYQDYNLEQQRQRLVNGLDFITRQLPEVKDKVKQSEYELQRFRNQEEVVNPEEQAKVQESKLNQLRQDQQTSLTEIKGLQTRFSSLQSQLAMSPEQAQAAARLSQSTRYQNLLSEIQKTDLALVQQRLRFNDNTPFVQQLLDQRRRQLNLLQDEASQALGSNASAGSFSQGQLGPLDVALVTDFINTYSNLKVAVARYNSQLEAEQQIRRELKRFPRLLEEYGRLQPEIALNRETLKQLLAAQQQLGLEIARGGFNWQVVEAPQLGVKTSAGMSKFLLLGAVVGVFLGGIAAFLREAMDDSVNSLDELRKKSAVPLLGKIPQLALDAEDVSVPLNLPLWRPPAVHPSTNQILQWKPFRESLDLLYQNIQLLSADSPLKSLVITSTQAGEGKSTLILGLAISAARLHQRVLLIDADLRHPTLHKLLDLPNEQGLSTFLTSQEPLPKRLAVQPANVRTNISVLTSGPVPPDPAKLLSSRRMQEIIAVFEQNYDLVLIDSPPVLGMVDATLMASRSSGVLLIGRMGRVKQAEFSQAIAALDKVNLVGVVANGVTYRSPKAVFYQPQAA